MQTTLFICKWKLRERVWGVSVGKEVWAEEKVNEVKEERENRK